MLDFDFCMFVLKKVPRYLIAYYYIIKCLTQSGERAYLVVAVDTYLYIEMLTAKLLEY